MVTKYADFAELAAPYGSLSEVVWLVWTKKTEGSPMRAPRPLSSKRQIVYSYYALCFDNFGCPMKQIKDRQVFHPILPPYLVLDYLALWRKTDDMSCVEYAAFIMDEALKRAESDRDEIIFLYKPETGLSSMPTSFYSALTQSWYLRTLVDLGKFYPGRYQKELVRVYHSLLLPLEDGGVLLKKPWGWIVEEYPHHPPLYTLNGWMTAVISVIDCRQALAEHGINADKFIEQNLDAIEHLLPLYDAGFCFNSRYQLSGFTRLKLQTKAVCPNLSCSDLVIVVPGETPIEIASEVPTEKTYRWTSYLERKSDRILQFNVVLSLSGYPEPCRFMGKIHSDVATSAKVLLADGDYRPDLTGAPTERWLEVGTIDLVEGSNTVDIEVPYVGNSTFAYPTNFKKKIGDLHYNAYHFIHILDLAKLYSYSRRQIFSDYARKWLEYIEEWSNMGIFTDRSRYSLEHFRYGDEFSASIEKQLNPS